VKWSLILSHLNRNWKYISINCHKNSFSVVVLKVCFADTKRSATSSQGIRGYSFLMATLKFVYFLVTRMMYFFCNFFTWRYVKPLEYLIQKPSVSTKRETNSLTQVKVMQCIVMYATGMYKELPKIFFFYFRYLSSGHYIYVSKNSGSVVIFRSLRGSASKKNLGKH
jgi:hypothetical protein